VGVGFIFVTGVGVGSMGVISSKDSVGVDGISRDWDWLRSFIVDTLGKDEISSTYPMLAWQAPGSRNRLMFSHVSG
jgi:hypothetical protein